MKKIITLLMVGLLLFGGSGAVFAQEAEMFEEMPLVQEEGDSGIKYEALKEFQDEFHQLNQLHIEHLQLKEEIVAKHDSIIDLYIEARENGDKEALNATREVRKELNAVNQEIRGLADQLKAESQSFREDAKNEDFEAAEEHMMNRISIAESIIDLQQEKIDLLESIIEILSVSGEAVLEM